MAILQLKAARNWSAAHTAGRFLLTATTIADWMKRLDDQGPDALVQLPQPVNRFPDFVSHTVQTLKSLCPTMGRRRIADTLARAGLHMSATTARRMIEKPPTPAPDAPTAAPANGAAHVAPSSAPALRRILVPLRITDMRVEVARYVTWYNEFRPHSLLYGATPGEVLRGLRPTIRKPRLEPQARFPTRGRTAAPQTRIRGKPGCELRFVATHHEGAPHLPIVSLRKAT